ncbi:MAG: hypothetical protein A3H45_10635 [Ignavibacteria bacterium RIFCSPLOWO2_02_FULL_55_14]|nr:MAG: hypothetical protein A3H45_10635 [Ignavibacteria bacterium RIFCSPLOWO2_02_FULL_55_14]
MKVFSSTGFRTVVQRMRFLYLGLLIFGSLQGQGREVIGYYPSWKWRSGNAWLSPENIPYEKLTMINYAFFSPAPDGNLTGVDTVGDAIILRGEAVGGPIPRARSKGLIEYAHSFSVRVVLSIGGWGDSGNFSAVASSEAGRRAFARSCVDAIRRFKFDGIDVDWEYPTYAPHNGKPEDTENCLRLFRTLRDSLDAYEDRVGRPILLTAAIPATDMHASGFNMPALAPLLDYVNVMTYDFYGSLDPISGHNAALFGTCGGDSTRSVDASLRLFTEHYGIPASKITLGIPFYGKTFAICGGPCSPYGRADSATSSVRSIEYAAIDGTMRGFLRSWDNVAQVPFAVDTTRNIFLTYDDEYSVALKAEYVINHGVAGVIIWEITGDQLGQGKSPLLDALASRLLRARTPK